MGTRGLTMIVSRNETKVAQYGQWDHYPEGQGATALNLMIKIVSEGKLSEFKEKVDNLRWLTDDEIDVINTSGDPFNNHPYLSRNWGAQIIEAVMYGTLTKEKGFMQPEDLVMDVNIVGLVNQESFAKDSLFCEWGYVIDLDKKTFEVYKGFNNECLTEDQRFNYLDIKNPELIEERDLYEKDGEKEWYHPIKMVVSYPLESLPTLPEFLGFFNEDEDWSDDN
jgi:hypothetical protein